MATADPGHVVPLTLERAAQRVGDVALVLDEQDGVGQSARPWVCRLTVVSFHSWSVPRAVQGWRNSGVRWDERPTDRRNFGVDLTRLSTSCSPGRSAVESAATFRPATHLGRGAACRQPLSTATGMPSWWTSSTCSCASPCAIRASTRSATRPSYAASPKAWSVTTTSAV